MIPALCNCDGDYICVSCEQALERFGITGGDIPRLMVDSEQETQLQSRGKVRSWTRLPGKMSKTRFDASRSATPILPPAGWLAASLALQVALIAALIWLAFAAFVGFMCLAGASR